METHRDRGRARAGYLKKWHDNGCRLNKLLGRSELRKGPGQNKLALCRHEQAAGVWRRAEETMKQKGVLPSNDAS